MRALLAWAADVARPGEGAPKILMALARLTDAPWVEGTPYVELAGDDVTTTISVYADHGLGIRERVVPTTRLAAPLDEFARAVQLAPGLAAPFEAAPRRDAIVLALPEAALEETRESITIDESSLHEQERKTAPPPPPEAPPAGAQAGPSGVHTHPTVRRMVAVSPDALRRAKDED